MKKREPITMSSTIETRGQKAEPLPLIFVASKLNSPRTALPRSDSALVWNAFPSSVAPASD